MRRYSIVLAAALFIVSAAQAQNLNTENGYIPGHAYQGNDIDTVDVSGGNMTLKIPIRSYKEEGSVSIDYYLYFPGKHFATLDPEGGTTGLVWDWVDPNPEPWISPYGSYGGLTGVYLMTNNDWHVVPSVYGIEETSPDGARHQFVDTSGPSPLGGATGPFPSADASGYAMVDGGITDPNGVGHGAGSYLDRNFVNSGYTDVSGRVLPYTGGGDGPPGASVSTSSCPAIEGEPTADVAFEVDFPGAYNPTTGHSYDAYIFCYAALHIHTNFQFTGGMTQFNQTMEFLQSVVLPNGQSWQFQYDHNPGDQSDLTGSGVYSYGDLIKVTYPTGAYTEYSYVNRSLCLIGDDSTEESRYLSKKIEHVQDPLTGAWKSAEWDYSMQLMSTDDVTLSADARSDSTAAFYGFVMTPENITQTYLFASQGHDACLSYEEGFLDGKGGGRITVNTITGYSAVKPPDSVNFGGATYSPRFVATWGPNQPSIATSKFYDEEMTPIYWYSPSESADFGLNAYLSHGSVIAEFTYPYVGRHDFHNLYSFVAPIAGPDGGMDRGESVLAAAIDTYMQSPVGPPVAVQAPTGSLPAGITRYVKTVYEYQSSDTTAATQALDYNLVGLVKERTVYGLKDDGSMGVASHVVNTYDDGTSMLSLSGGSSWPGFLASTSTWLSDSTWTTQTFTPDSHAEVATATDADGHTTSYGRDSNDVYITIVTRGEHTLPPVPCCGPGYGGGPIYAGGLTTHSTYDPGTGQIASQTDENSNTTTYTYGPMARLLKVEPPAIAAGQPEVDLCYTDLQSCPVVGAAPLTIVSQTKQSTSGDPVTISQSYDGFGRPWRSALYDSVGPIQTDTDYDNLGRKISVTNPYRSTSDPTYGVTTYAYPNPLTGEVDTTHPDGTVSTDVTLIDPAYTGYTLETVTGPHAITRRRDILGNLVDVWGDDGAATYGYDLNNNLTSANGRTFSYDHASRLLISNNPETGPIHYYYDLAGNLTSKLDARGVTTTMTYDALNRVVSKTNSGTGMVTTPTSCYLYDSPGTNALGRLVNEWTQTGACASTAPSNAASFHAMTYDAAGHIASETRCLGVNKCVNTANTYDLAGNLKTYATQQVTNPSLPGSYPVTVRNTYDSANRLQKEESQMNTLLPWATIYSVNAFSPAGPASMSVDGTTMTTTHTYDPMMRPTSGVTTLNH